MQTSSKFLLKERIIASCRDKKSAKKAAFPHVKLKSDVSGEDFANEIINQISIVEEFRFGDLSKDLKNKRSKKIDKKATKNKLMSLRGALRKTQQQAKVLDRISTSLSSAWLEIESLLFPSLAQLYFKITKEPNTQTFLCMSPTQRIVWLMALLDQEVDHMLLVVEAMKSKSGPEKSFIPVLFVGKIVRSVATHTEIRLASSARSKLHSFVKVLLEEANIGCNTHTLQGHIATAIATLPKST